MRKESKYNKTLIDFSEVILEDNKTLSIPVSGISMYPSLKDGDICFEEKCNIEDLKIGDIIACRSGNFLIMHRLRKLYKENGKYVLIMRGDNVLKDDKPFSEEQFVAKLVYFKRKGKIHQIDTPSMKFKKFIDDYFHPISCRINRSFLISRMIFHYFQRTFHSIRSNTRALLQGSSRLFRINIVISILKGLVPLAMIVSIKFLIDFISRDAQIFSEQKLIFFGLLALTAFLFMASGLLNQIGNYFSEKLSQSVTRKVYDDLHRKHIRLQLSDFENSAKLDKMHRAVQEASYRPIRILQSALGFIKTVSAGIVLLGLFVSIRWYLLLILLVAVLPETIFRILYVRRLYRMKESQAADEREKYYYNRVLTGFPFAKEMRLFAFSDYFIRFFNTKQDKIFDEKLALTKYETRYTILTQIFGVLLIFASLGIVSYLKISGLMSIGTVVLFFFAFQRGYGILNEFFKSVAGLIEDNTFLEDFLAFLRIPDTRSSKENVLQPFHLKKEIRFENISFKYESSERFALKDINIRIPVGKTVALVGENGAGKTTLVKLLCGFYTPVSGQIRIDDVDLNNIGQENLLSNVTAVFQDFALYQVSAMDNILLGDFHKQKNTSKAVSAAQIAGIADSLEKLPYGYNTRLGHLFKESEELSIGQWQKMALARAFYREAPLVLMDEPSSALDAKSERQIVSSLKQLAQDKTTLIVSHRLSTVQWADYIYFLENGEVAESGSHEELMKLNGKYFQLFKSKYEEENGL